MSQPSVKRNVAANVAGGLWNIALNLAVVPIQIRILGAEAFGLVSFMATLQTILSVLDLGLTVTIIRDVAADQSPQRQDSRELVQTAMSLYALIGFIFGLILVFGADWFARYWLNRESLSPEYASSALRIMAIPLVSNWLLNLAIATLTGLQRLDVVNVLRIVSRTIIQVGGIVVLLITHDLQMFLAWMAAGAIATLIIHAGFCQRLFEGLRFYPYFSRRAVGRVRRFALDVNATAILNAVFTQADSLLISKLLPLSLLGYYNVAYALTTGVANIQNFISMATLPTLAADYTRGEREIFALRYTKFVEVLMYIVGLPSLIFIFFGYDFLYVWAGVETARGASTALSILAFGFFLNAFVGACYNLTLAAGRARILVYVNLGAIPLYLPALYLFVIRFQLPGAATAWVLVNIYFTFVLLQSLFRSTFTGNILWWLVRHVLVFIGLGIIFGSGKIIVSQQMWSGTPIVWLVCGICSVMYLIAGFGLLTASLRQSLLRSVRHIFIQIIKGVRHNRGMS